MVMLLLFSFLVLGHELQVSYDALVMIMVVSMSLMLLMTLSFPWLRWQIVNNNHSTTDLRKFELRIDNNNQVKGSVAETSLRLEQIGQSILKQKVFSPAYISWLSSRFLRSEDFSSQTFSLTVSSLLFSGAFQKSKFINVLPQERVVVMEQQINVMSDQLRKVDRELVDLRNITKDIGAIQELRRRVMEFSEVFEEAANLSLWHPAVELIATSSEGNRLVLNTGTILVITMIVVILRF